MKVTYKEKEIEVEKPIKIEELLKSKFFIA